MDLVPTPSQTVGPFFHLGLPANVDGMLAGPDAKGQRVKLICRIFDGDGVPVPDAMIELWQANAEGRYPHPDDLWNNDLWNGDPRNKSHDPAFRGFGRMATSEEGSCVFETIMPGRVPGRGSTLQAPHVSVSVFARGLLKRLATRIYFHGNPANDEDAVLALVPPDRRDTLLARSDKEHPGTWQFEVHLCGQNETVFFDV